MRRHGGALFVLRMRVILSEPCGCPPNSNFQESHRPVLLLVIIARRLCFPVVRLTFNR